MTKAFLLSPTQRNTEEDSKNRAEKAAAHRLWVEPVVLVALHTDHSLNLATLQHLDCYLRHYPRPLRAIHWRAGQCIHHVLVHPKVQIVHAIQIPAGAM